MRASNTSGEKSDIVLFNFENRKSGFTTGSRLPRPARCCLPSRSSRGSNFGQSVISQAINQSTKQSIQNNHHQSIHLT